MMKATIAELQRDTPSLWSSFLEITLHHGFDVAFESDSASECRNFFSLHNAICAYGFKFALFNVKLRY